MIMMMMMMMLMQEKHQAYIDNNWELYMKHYHPDYKEMSLAVQWELWTKIRRDRTPLGKSLEAAVRYPPGFGRWASQVKPCMTARDNTQLTQRSVRQLREFMTHYKQRLFVGHGRSDDSFDMPWYVPQILSCERTKGNNFQQTFGYRCPVHEDVSSTRSPERVTQSASSSSGDTIFRPTKFGGASTKKLAPKFISGLKRVRDETDAM